MSTTSRFIGIAAGLLVGVDLTQPGRATATTPSAAPRIASGGGAAIAPAITTVSSGGATTAQSGTAIAYPYYAGSPGLAPDHTIVVTGTGQADVPADGSNQAAAQKTALAAALADAKTQADAIAADTGLTISGVLSVSASVSSATDGVAVSGSSSGSASSGPACIVAVPGSGSSASEGTVAPQPACVPEPVYPQTVSVSVTVEYSVG